MSRPTGFSAKRLSHAPNSQGLYKALFFISYRR